MKYHATPTTIFISIIVVLLFIGVAFFILTQLNLTSPTLIVTNLLFEEVANIDSDIGVSFSSIERNLRDGININDLEMTYRGSRVLFFEKVSLNRGLFSFITFVLTGQDKLGITATNGIFIMPEFDFAPSSEAKAASSFDFEKDISLEVPDILKRWGFDLSIQNMDLQLTDNFAIGHSNIWVNWNNGIENSSVTIDIPEATFKSDAMIANANNFLFKLNENNGLNLSLDVGVLSFSGFGLIFNGDKISISSSTPDYTKINISKLPLFISMEDFAGSYENALISSRFIESKIGEDGASLKFSNVALSYNEWGAYIRQINLNSSDFETAALSFDTVNVNKDRALLLNIPKISSLVDFVELSGSISVPVLKSGNINTLTNGYLSKASLENLNITASLEEKYSFELGTNATLDSNHELLNGITFDLSLGLDLDGGQLGNFTALISDARLPNLDKPIGLELAKNGDLYSLATDYDNSIVAFAGYDGDIKLALSFDDFNINEVDYLIDLFAPSITRYVAPSTVLNGDIKLDLYAYEDSPIGFNGPIASTLSLQDISFNNYLFDIENCINLELLDYGISIDEIDIETEWADLMFVGTLDYEKRIPEGQFLILSADREDTYFGIDLFASDYREYTFFAKTPMLRDTNISGLVNFASLDMISSEFQFTVLGSSFPLDLRLDLANDDFSLFNENLDLNVDWSELLTIDLMLDEFKLSEETPEFIPSSISGNIGLAFDFANQEFSLSMPSFYLKDIYRLPGHPDVFMSAVGDNFGITIGEITIDSDSFETLKGKGSIKFGDFSVAVSLSDGIRDGELYVLSVIEHSNQYIGSIRLDNVLMSRFGFEDMIGQFNLTGSAAKIEDFAFSGKFEAEALDPTNDYRKIYADIFIDDSYIDFTDVIYSNDTIYIGIENLDFDSYSGILSIDNCNAGITIAQADGPFIIEGGLSLEAYLPPHESLAASFSELIRNKAKGLEFAGKLNYAGLDSKLFSSEKAFTGMYDGSRFVFDGEFLNGYYSMQDGDVDLRVNVDPILDFTLKGDFKVDGKYDVLFDVAKVDLSFINYIFSQPIVQFLPGHFVYGDIHLSPNEEGFTLRGSFESDYAELETFWLPNQKVLLHDINFIVWDNDFESILSNATVLNLENYSRAPTDVRFSISFSDAFSYEGWDLDIYIDEDQYIDFRFPMTSSNIDIVGKANGHLGMMSTSPGVSIFGELAVADTTLSLGMHPLPDWYNPTMKTQLSLDVDIKNNVQFVFPLGANPILRTNIADDSHINFEIGSGGIKADGDIPLRSGEIFYFQKYFYITEGNIKLREGASGIDPVINLRARLRDFDENGEKIDIYLVLRESTLNNLSPTLESSPSKDMNELMSILENSILPTSTTQSASSVEAVASLAAASVDILQKFGIIGSEGMSIDSSIRNALSLDTFSMHSNIVANLLSDTVSLAGFSSSSSPYSPMARYLDGTTLYLGKYLNPDFYLQALIHLSADRGQDSNGFAFIADDLLLDTEISLEWTNPLLTVTYFTNPSNFTLYELIDKFGFTFSKRILF